MPKEFYILDIGCNEGDLTLELLSLVQNELKDVKCFVLGVDLDKFLIDRANAKSPCNDTVQFKMVDVMGNDLEAIDEYLSSHSISKFSVVCCFSITMWIHMNHGDEGFKSFLKLSSGYSSSCFIIEPQLWKCYRKAIQRCRRLGMDELPYYQDLTIRDAAEYVKNFILANGYGTCTDLGTMEWGRPLLFFLRNS